MKAKVKTFFKKNPKKILIVCTRRLGDVLLTTPLIHSMKKAWPEAKIDLLVFQGTESIVAGNLDIHHVLTVPARSKWLIRLRELCSLWNQYDFSCAINDSDRARFYSFFAGKKRFALIEKDHRSFWVRLLFNGVVFLDPQQGHMVETGLKFATLLGIKAIPTVIPPRLSDQADDQDFRQKIDQLANKQPYVVVHLLPMYVYKRWTSDNWVALIKWFHQQQYRVVLTGGAAEIEKNYAQSIEAHFSETLVNYVGQLSFAQTAYVIEKAKLYVGPDTSTTHIAAAIGTPTVALFGPSNPIKWGPWPKTKTQIVWPLKGSTARNNVYLLQGQGDCVPCLQEGCERHINSESRCLTGLSVQTAIQACQNRLQH